MSGSAEKRKAAQEHNELYEYERRQARVRALFKWIWVLAGGRKRLQGKRGLMHRRAAIACVTASAMGALPAIGGE